MPGPPAEKTTDYHVVRMNAVTGNTRAQPGRFPDHLQTKHAGDWFISRQTADCHVDELDTVADNARAQLVRCKVPKQTADYHVDMSPIQELSLVGARPAF